MLNGAATIFVVTDMARCTAFYRDGLGFTVSFEYGAPVSYACLCRDKVDLHLLSTAETKRQPGQGALYIFVTDVDAIHAEITARGIRCEKAPKDYDYGMRDFDLFDPDGNHITFGMATGTD